MQTAKKIVFRILIIVMALIGMNFIYQHFFFEKDVQEHSELINLVRAIPDSTNILYVAESSNITFRGNDADKSPISGFLSEYFPGLTVKDITKPAAHAGIYYSLLSNIPDRVHIQTVVVTLNLRSFNAQWIFSDLETPLQKSVVLLRDYPPLLDRFLLSFKAYDIKSEKERELQVKRMWKKDVLKFNKPFPYKNVVEWDKNMYHLGIKNEDGTKNQELTSLACHYIKGYAFQIDTNTNPRIKDFNDIVDLARERGWNLVFNLLAENTQKAQQLVGNDLIYLIEQNRKLLIEYYRRKGVTVVDNLYAIDDEQYIDQNWTTEHYAEKGRKKIAQNVAEDLRKFHDDEYRKADLVNQARTVFFHDCEMDLIWPQMQTFTDKEAFSGKFSSQTGKGNDFSLTFEYPLQNIPDTLRNSVSIHCKIFQYSSDNEAKIIIETSGSKESSDWNAIPINSQINETNVWLDYDFTYNLPERCKSAPIIKVYLFNTSNKIVLLDDLKIEFH